MRKFEHKKRIHAAIMAALLFITLTFAACTPRQSQTPDSVPPASEELAQVKPTETVPLPVTPSPEAANPGLAVYVFNVGEALSILIDDGETEVLIDAGNDRDGPILADKVAAYIEDGTIEYVIATHSHADHIGGMEDIYEAWHVAHTIYGDPGTSKQYQEFLDAAQAEENSDVKEDEDAEIPLQSGAMLSVLDILDGASNTNNNSVVTVLETNGQRMLVTGDAEDEKSKEVQTGLVGRLQSRQLYPIDVYIVGHHGSETSSSQSLLSLIKPSMAVISSEGPDGRYKNPDKDVIRRLAAAGARIFGTWHSGDIKITFDADGIAASPPESEQLTPENYARARRVPM